MTPNKKKAPAATGAIKSEPNVQEGEQTMSTLSMTPEKFDTSMRSTANHGGDTIITSIGYSTLHERHDIIVNFVNRYGEVIYLDLHEASDLIKNIQAQLTHLLEEDVREITRWTEPGNPSFEEAL